MAKEGSGTAGVAMETLPAARSDVRDGPRGLGAGGMATAPPWGPLDGEAPVAQAPCFSCLPTIAERKRSPDSPGMPSPGNVRKVWSAECGHQKL